MEDKDTRVNERWAPADPDARGYAAPTGRGYPAGDSARGDRSPDEIRAEIEQTRANMTETVGAIEERLRPGTVLSRAATNARDTTTGKVKQMAARMEDMVPDGATRNPIVTRVRENPVPAALAAVSLAWLAFSGRRHSTARTAAWQPGVGDRVGQATSEATAAAQSAAHETGERVRRTTTQARRRARRFSHENAMAAAALAAAAGMAVGFALPETERENELMGEARDAALDRAKQTARTATDRVQHVAEDVKREVTRATTDAVAGPDPRSDEARGWNRR